MAGLLGTVVHGVELRLFSPNGHVHGAIHCQTKALAYPSYRRFIATARSARVFIPTQKRLPLQARHHPRLERAVLGRMMHLLDVHPKAEGFAPENSETLRHVPLTPPDTPLAHQVDGFSRAITD